MSNERQPRSVQALIVEDNADDVAVSVRALRAASFEIHYRVVRSRAEFVDALGGADFDAIFADCGLPGWCGLEAIDLVKQRGTDVPVILVTGALGEEAAVEALRRGATDYVLKSHLGRLPLALERALNERRARQAERAAQEALLRSEATYRSLVEDAAFAIFQASAAGESFREINPALVEMLGYRERGEVLKLSLSRDVFVRPLDWTALVAQAGVEGIRYFESDWKRRDGSVIRVRFSSRAPGRDLLEFVAEDVTEQRRNAHRVAQLSRLYSVLWQVNRAIGRIDEPVALYRDVCRIAVEQGGFAMAWFGVVAGPGNPVEPVAFHAGRAGAGRACATPAGGAPLCSSAAESALRTGLRSISNQVQTHPSVGGRDLACGCVCSGAFPIRVRGQAIGVFQVCSSDIGTFDPESVALVDEVAADVSIALDRIELEAAQAQSERQIAKLAAMVEGSPDAIAGLDFAGRLTSWNPGAMRMLGYTESEVIGQPLGECLELEDRERYAAALRTAALGNPASPFQTRCRGKHGDERHVSVALSPIRGGDGSIIGVAAIARDITTLKQLEFELLSKNKALERQNREVEKANRSKSEFLANMSHELRSPLNGAIGFCELLRDGRYGALAPDQQEAIEHVLASSRHLLQLISDLLDLSRIEAGRIEFVPELVRVASVVREVAHVLAPVAAQKDIEVRFRLDERLEAVTDPAKLKQILYNYLSNALKFTPAGGRVALGAGQAGTSMFRLEVSDTGMGIAERDFGRLWVPFEQLDISTAKFFQGTGLGLALTKRIAEAEGGRVGFVSSEGGGSTFWAELPMRLDPSRNSSSARTVLVIEDDTLDQRRIVRALNQLGCAADVAGSGAEAAAKAVLRRYAAITLDLLLRDSNPWDLLDEIRRTENRLTPVIVVSLVAERGAAAVFDVQGQLTKPIDEAEMEAALRSVLRPSEPAEAWNSTQYERTRADC